MWRTMMRVWLVGAVITIGALDGFPEAVDQPLVVRTAIEAGETVRDEAPPDADAMPMLPPKDVGPI